MTLRSYHRNPFDRLMAPQCLAEGLPVLSRKDALDDYGIARLWQSWHRPPTLGSMSATKSSPFGLMIRFILTSL
jgi:hypothetical protein